MRLIMVGSLDEEALADLGDQPVVVLTGSIDEVRAAGALLYQDVGVALTVPCAPIAPERET